MAAVAHKIPILPVSVNGNRRVLPKGSLVVKLGKIQVVIGDLIDTSGYTTYTAQKLIDKTRQAVIANLDPEYILFLLHRHHTAHFVVSFLLTYKINNFIVHPRTSNVLSNATRDTMMVTEVTVVEYLATGITRSARRSNGGSL